MEFATVKGVGMEKKQNLTYLNLLALKMTSRGMNTLHRAPERGLDMGTGEGEEKTQVPGEELRLRAVVPFPSLLSLVC